MDRRRTVWKRTTEWERQKALKNWKAAKIKPNVRAS